ncbi:MAG: hypothetical protein H7343_06000 [Undibacterium sp.]|nr:hypothetical protein [Opitutaceae bacterium]
MHERRHLCHGDRNAPSVASPSGKSPFARRDRPPPQPSGHREERSLVELVDYGGQFTLTPLASAVTSEAETLDRTTSGQAVSVDAEAGASSGTMLYLNSTATGHYIGFTTPSLPAGTYSVRLGYKSNTGRATHSLTIDGAQVGTTLDQYAATQA